MSDAASAVVTPEQDSSSALAALTPDERHSWQQTGEWPARPPVEPATESDDDADDEPAAEPAKPAPVVESKPVSKRQQQINDLIRDRAAADERAKKAEERLAALEAKTAPAKPDTEPAKPPAASDKPATDFQPTRPKPQSSEFQTYDDYTEALAEWKIDQREAKAAYDAEQKRAADAKQNAQQTFKTRAEAWISRRDAFAKTNPAFTEKATPLLERVTAGTPLGDVLIDSPVGPQLALHLAEHPEELTRIGALDPLAQIRALGRLEALYDAPVPAPAQPEVKTVTSAPAPPVTLTPQSSTPGDEVSDAVSRGDFRAFAAAANKADLARRR